MNRGKRRGGTKGKKKQEMHEKLGEKKEGISIRGNDKVHSVREGRGGDFVVKIGGVSERIQDEAVGKEQRDTANVSQHAGEKIGNDVVKITAL